MASATIKVSDNADGTVNITCAFKPDLVMKSDGTPAQHMALRVMDILSGDPDRIHDEDE